MSACTAAGTPTIKAVHVPAYWAGPLRPDFCASFCAFSLIVPKIVTKEARRKKVLLGLYREGSLECRDNRPFQKKE